MIDSTVSRSGNWLPGNDSDKKAYMKNVLDKVPATQKIKDLERKHIEFMLDHQRYINKYEESSNEIKQLLRTPGCRNSQVCIDDMFKALNRNRQLISDKLYRYKLTTEVIEQRMDDLEVEQGMEISDLLQRSNIEQNNYTRFKSGGHTLGNWRKLDTPSVRNLRLQHPISDPIAHLRTSQRVVFA